MSKRTETDAFGESPVSERADDPPSKKHRLEVQAQLKRGSALAAQWRDTINNEDPDIKPSAADRIAAEELVHIFENLEQKSANTSKSVDGLITAQIKIEVGVAMENLAQKAREKSNKFTAQITKYLKPEDPEFEDEICERVEKRMADVTSGDYVAKIKETIKSTMAEAFDKGVNEELFKIMKI